LYNEDLNPIIISLNLLVKMYASLQI